MLAEEEAAAAAEKARIEEENKSKPPTQQKPTTTAGPNATVLKPRSAALPKPGGLVLKTPSEKPTLVSKPATTAPVRSPWASLPPVDKVAPIEINPPVQAPSSRPQQNGAYGANSMAPPAPPAVEIAADDFTRTRRDTQNGHVGQLFNANSGEYEPAQHSGRRASVWKDQSGKTLSLLQRGSANESQRPAEPSAAFQTRHNQQDSSTWQRRNSNVSGESGLLGRKMSISKGSDGRQDRRESQQSQVMQSPTTSSFGHAPTQSATQSPALQHSQLSQDGRSAAGSPYQNRTGPPDQNNMRDDVAAQKQLMKEKRELAIKRRKEEEEREEAAKKERIRKKMEALGLEPLDERKESAKEVQSKTIEKRPTPQQELEVNQEAVRETPQAASPLTELSATAAKSPPKPPAPKATGAPQQYGMMKVHGTPNNVAPQGNERLSIERTKSQPPSQKISPPGLETKTETVDHITPPLVNGVTTQESTDSLVQESSDLPTQNHIREPRQPWNNPQRDPNSYMGWNSQNTTRDPNSVSNSVWGAPTQSRALGNGTFDRTIQRPQSRQQDQYPSPALAPIGPPKHLQHSKDLREPSKMHDTGLFPAGEDSQTIPSFPPSEAPAGTGRSASGNQVVSPPHLAPGAQHRPRGAEFARPSQEVDRKATLAAWGNFQATSAREDAEKNKQIALQNEARFAEEARTGIRYEPQLAIMNETWRQVKVDPEGVRRSIVGVSRAQNTHGAGPSPHAIGDAQGPPFVSSTNVASTTPIPGAARGSRFFPTMSRSIHPYHTPAPFAPGYRRGSSPPPPDSVFHPAFSRDHPRPVVHLPLVNPKPKVRLPPATVTPLQSPNLALAEVQPVHLKASSQPLVNNPSWQDRFNGLLGVKKSSPEKRVAQIVGFSATKEPFDLPRMHVPASVSLPPKSEQQVGSGILTASKNLEDQEALFDEPESGSLPVVLLPKRASAGAWGTSKSFKRGPSKPFRSSKEVEAASKELFAPTDIISEGALLVFVKVLGMSVSKSKAMPRINGQITNQTTAGPQGYQGLPHQQPYSGNSKSAKASKPRDISYPQNTKSTQNGSPRIQHGSSRNAHRGPHPQSRPQSSHASAAR